MTKRLRKYAKLIKFRQVEGYLILMRGLFCKIHIDYFESRLSKQRSQANRPRRLSINENQAQQTVGEWRQDANK